MTELHIDDELKAWIDPLSPEEYAQLEVNILAEGCREPITVWGGYILDGHNRYEICTRHSVQFSTVEKTGLVTKEDALIWMAQHQLGKRNLSDFSRVALALRLKPLLEQCAHARMIAGRAASIDPVQKSAQGTGRTRDELAKKAGVSHDTVQKVEKIIESGNVDVIAQVRAGEISINAAAKKVAPQRAQHAPSAGSLKCASGDAHSVTPETSSDVATSMPAAAKEGEVCVLNVGPSQDVSADRVPQNLEMAPVSLSEVQQLRDQLAAAQVALNETIAENDEMGRVFDADDRLAAAMAEIKRYKASAESAKQSLDSKMGENNLLIKTVKDLRRVVEREKNRADDAERRLAQVGAAA